MSRYLTIQEACEILRLGERTVYDMCRKGKLPGVAKVGGSWRIEEKALHDYMKAGGEIAEQNQENAKR